jgi:hypothetical protein
MAGDRGRCTICDHHYNTMETARRHYLIVHSKNKRFSCVMCGKESNNVYAFRMHIRTYHHITGVKDVAGVYGIEIVDK